jgi:transposase
MSAKKYIVTLTKDEKAILNEIINKGKHSAEKRKRAQALLLAEGNYTGDMIADRTGLSRRGLEQLRQRFVEEGFEVTLAGKPRGHRPKTLNGADEARLIALVCSPKPDGRTRWTLRLLADKWSTLAHTETKTISRETVRRAIKKTKSAYQVDTGHRYRYNLSGRNKTMAKQESMDILEFQQRFPTNDACRDHLFKIRWPNGLVCPVCSGKDFYTINTRTIYECKCGHQVSLTAGTVMHGSHTPLAKWFWAIYLAAHDKRGVSALRLAKELGSPIRQHG